MFGLYDTLTQDVTANKSKGLDVQLHEGITNDFLASHIVQVCLQVYEFVDRPFKCTKRTCSMSKVEQEIEKLFH